MADGPATQLPVPPPRLATAHDPVRPRTRSVKKSAMRGMAPVPALPRPDAVRWAFQRPLQRYLINVGPAW